MSQRRTRCLHALVASLLALFSVHCTSGGDEKPPADRALFAVKTGEVYGFIDSTGKTAIPFHFIYAQNFSNGLALVRLDDEHRAFIDASGKIVFEVPKEYALVADFEGGFARINIGGHYNIDAMDGGNWKLLDKTGKLLEPAWTSDHGPIPIRAFSEGLAAFSTGADKWGFINSQAKVVIGPTFDEVGDFHEGRAAVKVGEKWGYIDQSGKFTIKLQFDFANRFSQGIAGVWTVTPDESSWRFINGRGEIVLPLGNRSFGDDAYFAEGLAPIEKGFGGSPLGYINKAGDLIIPFQFAEARAFSGGLAAVRMPGNDGKWGFIDHRGKWVISPKYDDVRGNGFQDGLATAITGPYYELIDPHGKLVSRFEP